MFPPLPVDSPMPAQIGPFKVLEVLGMGGQGVVYLGQDAAGERVAIKSVPGHVPPDSPAVKRLRREAEFLGVLDHPNIARVSEPLVQDDRVYLVMEYVPGQTLAERLAYGPLPPNDGLTICRQIALAIDAAHRARVVHRDLKPANIRITPEGVVKVIDFGVAAYSSAPGERSHAARAPDEHAPALVGTYGYMSLEQMMGIEVGFPTDIWSFGCILFECLVGRPLLIGVGKDDFFIRLLHAGADLSGLPADVPRTLRAVLEKCLARHPKDRPTSMAEIAGVIETILNHRLPSGMRPGSLTNLPRQAGAFVGREREIAAIAAQLRFARGVCITGYGGCGKTRLAVEIGRRLEKEFREGVWYVDLSERSQDEPLVAIIGEALAPAVSRRRHANAAADGTEEERLAARLGNAQTLIVLDQCDFHGPALASLSSVLAERCPRVRMVMTSRERLGIQGHEVCELRPLPVPPPHADRDGARRLLHNESVRLFVDRARHVDRGYAPDDEEAADIAALCRRLEGLPLAVELAGAGAGGGAGGGAGAGGWGGGAGSLRAADIARRLDSVLYAPSPPSETAVLPAQTRPRHRTLDACIRWSFNRLTSEERDILTRLSVFRGGWTLEAAEAVCAPDLVGPAASSVQVFLARLVNKSLITYDAQAGRYSMFESVKAFAQSCLDPRTWEELRRRHAQYFHRFAKEKEGQLLGSEQASGIRATQADLENFSAAIEAADVPGISQEMIVETAVALGRFWYLRGAFREARRRFEDILERAHAVTGRLRARVMIHLGALAFGTGEFEMAEAWYRRTLEIAQDLGDDKLVATCWDNIASACNEQHARAALAEDAFRNALSIYERARDSHGLMRVKLNYSYYFIRQGRLDDAERLCTECLDWFRSIQERKREATTLHNLGEIAYFRARHDEAHQFFARSLAIKDLLGDRRGSSLSLYMCALSLIERDAHALAAMLMAKAMEIRAELGITDLPMPQADHDHSLAKLAHALGSEQFAEAWSRGRELFDEEAIQSVATTVQSE